MAMQAWQLATLQLIYDDTTGITDVKLQLDDVDVGMGSFQRVYIDNPDWPHYAGAEIDRLNSSNTGRRKYYHGMIAEIRCYGADQDLSFLIDTTGTCGAGQCSTCPADENGDPICLVDCGSNELLIGEICVPCQPECERGCVREENCNLCYDEECNKCDGFSEDFIC